MFKKSAVLLLSFTLCASAFAATSAKELMSEAEKKASVTESIQYLQKQIPSLAQNAEKRSALAFLASLQEQSGLFSDAEKNYAAAAAIGSPDAAGMPKKSAEQLVLDAVRCALCLGDSQKADSYLNSAVRNSKSEKVIATVKLYEQWSALCRASSLSDLEEPVALLTAYASLDSMKSVRASILLTLWHVAGEEKWAAELKKSYPKSAEAAIVKGETQQLPTPFWFFVPRKGSTVPEVADEKVIVKESDPASTKYPEKAADSKTASAPNAAEKTPAAEKPLKQQLGLFRDEANAKRLVEEVQKKGFKASITTEKRASGTTYYLVVVDENKAGSMGNELRNAGFECYPLF